VSFTGVSVLPAFESYDSDDLVDVGDDPLDEFYVDDEIIVE